MTIPPPRPGRPNVLPSAERARADERLLSALAACGGRDPRPFYRERLRELKERNPVAYEEAVRYFDEALVPAVAAGEEDALSAWTEYGRRLAELCAPGRTSSIDATGRAEPYRRPTPPDHLVLHLPDSRKERALLVALPPELTPAQRATYDWLVAGRQKLKEDGS